MDDDVVRCVVLEPMHRGEPERVGYVAEPEPTSVEEVRAQIGQHAGALVAPGRIAHQAGGAVTVEHPARIDCTELSRRDQIAHSHEMRLEAVVVSSVTKDRVFAGKGLQLDDRAFVVCRQRLLDQHVFAVLQAISEQFQFRCVGYARQNRIVLVDWNVGRRSYDACGPELQTRQPRLALVTDQSGPICRSIASILSRKSSAVTGILPSHSHSTAAAIEPRMVATPGSRTASIASVA